MRTQEAEEQQWEYSASYRAGQPARLAQSSGANYNQSQVHKSWMQSRQISDTFLEWRAFPGNSNTTDMPSSLTSNLVEIQGLTKSYGGFEAVKDLNLSVSYGQIFALLGPNGAGKTTTIRMLMGILAPTAGSARIDGLDCFQDRVEVENRTRPLLQQLELHDALEEFAVNYSRGMKKKLALVCAMLHDPALLILDEPTNGLDPFATRALHRSE